MIHVAFYDTNGVIERIETHSNNLSFTDGLVVDSPSVMDNYIVVNGELVQIPSLANLGENAMQ